MDEAVLANTSAHIAPAINESGQHPKITPIEAAQRIEESLRKAFEGGVVRLSKTAIRQRAEKAYGPEIGPLVSAGLKILADNGVVKESDPTPRERMAYGPIHCDKFFEIEGKIIDATKEDETIDFDQIEVLLVAAAGSLESLADAVERLITTDKQLFSMMREAFWVRLHEAASYLEPLLKSRDAIRRFLPVHPDRYRVTTPLPSPTTFELFIKFVHQCDWFVKMQEFPDENVPEMLGEAKGLLLLLACVEFKDRHKALTFAQTEIRMAERRYFAERLLTTQRKQSAEDAVGKMETVKQGTSADGNQGDVGSLEGVTEADVQCGFLGLCVNEKEKVVSRIIDGKLKKNSVSDREMKIVCQMIRDGSKGTPKAWVVANHGGEKTALNQFKKTLKDKLSVLRVTMPNGEWCLIDADKK